MIVINYKIVGNSMQQLLIELSVGQTVYSEAGKFLWKTDNIEFETSFNVSDKKACSREHC